MGREARANAAAAFVPTEFVGVNFLKVDLDKRTVTGLVTDEILDRQGDVVDFDTALKFFVDEKLWPGNIREQHDPEKPVGSKVTAVPDLEKRNIELTAYISEACPDTWTKICDKTLKGFSIGGKGKRVTEKVEGGHTANRLFLTDLYEVSVVDNPANPRAMFTIAKAVGGHMTYTEPVAAEQSDPSPLDAASEALDMAAKAAKAPPAAAVAVVGKGAITALLLGLAGAKDRLTQKASIIATATEAGLLAELPKAWGGEFVAKGMPEPWDIDSALAAISMLEWLLSTEYYDARFDLDNAGNPDPVKVAQVAALKAAIDAVLRFVISEHQEQFAEEVEGDAGAPIILSDDSAVQMFVSSLGLITKAGARHSKADQAMVQKVHDMAGDLGAVCAKDMVADEDAAKAVALTYLAAHAGDDDVIKALATVPGIVLTADEHPPSEAVTKLTADLEAAKALLGESQATVAKQAETVAALDERLKLIEGQPLPGGPAARVVPFDKAVGGPSTPSGEVPPTEVLKAFDQMAALADSDADRMKIAQKKLTFMRENHLGELDVVSGSPRPATA